MTRIALWAGPECTVNRIRSGYADQLQQSLAPGGGGIRAVDFAAEHQLGFWEAAAASSPGMS